MEFHSLSPLQPPAPKAQDILYSHVLSSQGTAVCLHFKERSMPAALCPLRWQQGWGGMGRGPHLIALTFATTPWAGLLSAALHVLSGGCQPLPPQKYTI